MKFLAYLCCFYWYFPLLIALEEESNIILNVLVPSRPFLVDKLLYWSNPNMYIWHNEDSKAISFSFCIRHHPVHRAFKDAIAHYLQQGIIILRTSLVCTTW